MHHIVVGGVIILHMAFMFLQQSDLVTLGDLLCEFTSIPRQTKKQPVVLGLSAALVCFVFYTVAAHTFTVGPKKSPGQFVLAANKLLSISHFCMIVVWP